MSVCACLIDVHLSEGDNSGWADLFDQSFKRVYPQDLATGCRKFTPNPIITSSHLTFSETQFRQSCIVLCNIYVTCNISFYKSYVQMYHLFKMYFGTFATK